MARLILWDIDGTLLRAGIVGAETFGEAFEEILGHRPGVDVAMSGKTDPQIVREYLDRSGVPADEDLVEAVLGALVRRLDARAADLPRLGYACPGITDLLPRLAADPGVVSSVLTGNLAPNALTKLRAFGLDRWLDLSVAAYGSDRSDRNELVPLALHRLEERRGLRPDAGEVWVVGDTPLDLACARAAGARCLLVATGRTSLAELGSLGADACLADLADTAAVEKLLTADL